MDADGAGLMEGCRRRVVFDVKNNTVGGYDEEGSRECDFDNVGWGGAEVWCGSPEVILYCMRFVHVY